MPADSPNPTAPAAAWGDGLATIAADGTVLDTWYPAPQLGGPDFIRTVRGPIRDIPMLAGGLIALDMIDSYLDAGCVAVNLGGSLAVPDLVKKQQWDEIGRRVMLAASIVQSRKTVVQHDTYVH